MALGPLLQLGATLSVTCSQLDAEVDDQEHEDDRDDQCAGVAAVLSSPDLGSSRRGFAVEVAVPLAGAGFTLAALYMIAVLVEWLDSGRPRSPGRVTLALLTADPSTPTRPGTRLPVDVNSLPADEVEALLNLRQRTLRILADRGEIEPEIVERARSVPLGRLHTLKSDADEIA